MTLQFSVSSNYNRFILALISFLILSACSSLQPRLDVIHNQHDPLINKIYSASGPSPKQFDELIETMTQSDVIYVGENHDNTHHHKIQFDVIKALVEKGLRPTIGFEFFSRHQTSHLIRFLKSDDKFHQADSTHSAEKLLRVQLGWAENRDDDWAHLYPILKYAREHELQVFGADLSPVTRKRLSKNGYTGLSAVEKLLVPKSDFIDSAYQEYMYQSFTRAHCGWRDENYLRKLYATWLARNEAMAQSIVATLTASPGQPIVMILGAGHTEYNMAVYERVATFQKDIKQLNLRLQAVAEKPLKANDYFQTLSIGGKIFGEPFEYIWFTSRMPEKEDPCKAYLKYKNKHATSHKSSS